MEDISIQEASEAISLEFSRQGNLLRREEFADIAALPSWDTKRIKWRDHELFMVISPLMVDEETYCIRIRAHVIPFENSRAVAYRCIFKASDGTWNEEYDEQAYLSFQKEADCRYPIEKRFWEVLKDKPSI